MYYSVRIQYTMDDTLLTDVFTCDQAFKVNNRIMELLEDNKAIIQALRVVRVNG